MVLWGFGCTSSIFYLINDSLPPSFSTETESAQLEMWCQGPQNILWVAPLQMKKFCISQNNMESVHTLYLLYIPTTNISINMHYVSTPMTAKLLCCHEPTFKCVCETNICPGPGKCSHYLVNINSEAVKHMLSKWFCKICRYICMPSKISCKMLLVIR